MTVNFQKRKSNVGLAFAMGVLVALTVLSVVVRNFWRRYLCPYGALLGILSLIVMFTGVSSPRVPPFGAVGMSEIVWSWLGAFCGILPIALQRVVSISLRSTMVPYSK